MLCSKYGLNGWLTSLEGNIELEVCLFYLKENQIELNEIVNKDYEKYYKDSLKKINIFPTKDFYERTYKKIRGKYPEKLDKKTIWSNYQQHIIGYINEYVNNKNDTIRNQEYYSNLRTRLEI